MPLEIHQTLTSLLPSLDEAHLTQITNLFSTKRYTRGEPLLQQGQHWNKALVLKQGLIRMHYLRSDGREFNKNFFAEGAFLCPITPAMQDTPSLFAISCVEDCEILHSDINDFISQLPISNWESLQRILLMRLLDSKLQREHDLLTLNAKQRYQKFCDTQSHLADRIPLTQLASYLGVTDVSLSRLRRQIKES